MNQDVCVPTTDSLQSLYVYNHGLGGGKFFQPGNTCASSSWAPSWVDCPAFCTALNYADSGHCVGLTEMTCLGANLTNVGFCLCQEDPMENGDEVDSIMVDAPMDAVINTCTQIDIETEGIGGQQSVGGDLTVHLFAGTNDGVVPMASPFYLESNCMTPITQTVIEDGTSSAVVYFKVADAGTYTLTGVINGLGPNWDDILITASQDDLKKVAKKSKRTKKRKA